MTDAGTLLKLAALAIGEKCEQIGYRDFGLYKPRPGIVQPYVAWNPLEDDADAFRLAVALRLGIINDGYVVVVRTTHPHKFGAQVSLGGTEPCEATRRAIVLAAAEIGKEVK